MYTSTQAAQLLDLRIYKATINHFFTARLLRHIEQKYFVIL